MAEDNNQIRVEIVLDDGSIQKGFVKMQEEAQKTGNFLSRAFSIGGFADLSAAINLARGAYRELSSAVKDGVAEAIEGEKSSLRLASAMKSISGVTDESIRSFASFTDQLSKKVGIDNDVINSNAAVLSSLGKLSGEGLERATKAAVDLSAGLDISLDQAFRRVALAAEGNVNAFSRLGFEFKKGASDSEKFASVLGQIEGRFGGLAQSQALNTFGGLIKTLEVAFKDTEQALGNLITSSPAVRELLKFIIDGFRSLTDQINLFSKAGGLDTLLINLVKFSGDLNTYVIKPVEVLFNLLKLGFEGLDVAVKNVIAAIGLTGAALAKLSNAVGINNELTESMKEFGMASAVVAGESIRNFTDISTVLNTPITEGLGSGITDLQNRLTNLKPVQDAFTMANGSAKQSVDDIKGAITSGIIYNEQYGSSFEAISAAFKSIKNSLREAALDIGVSSKDIAKSLINGVGGAAGNAFAAFGKAVATGKDAMQAFINSLLSSLGQMAVQMGTQFILQGIAYSFAGLPNGPALISAGAALATFGGILSGLGAGAEGGGAGAGAGGGGGIGAVGGGIETSPETVADIAETRQPKEGLIVNINGDILGDEASGRRLVDLMNAAFDTGGITLRQGIA